MPEHIIWLDAAESGSAALLGGKAARLAAMMRAGFPVPPGFCLTTAAYQEPLFASSKSDVIAAYRRLDVEAVAVRSSATTEDLAAASFAGQQDTFLNVRGEEELLDAIERCRASLWSERAVAYRRERGVSESGARMAVVVQVMIPCDAAGVAFSVDPLSGREQVTVECTTGALTPRQTRQVTESVAALETLFGSPQDVEWGFWQGRLYLFQSRPITASATGFFTEVLTGDEDLWTSGFLNERFPQPVSPLGWTLIRELLEPLALAEPLRYMGYRAPPSLRLTKLHYGRPYVNVRVFQILYRPFPRSLLPEDARRYFPEGDTELRKQAGYPRGMGWLRMFACLVRSFARDPFNWSPLHNHRRWERFKIAHDRTMRELDGAGEPGSVQEAWDRIDAAQALNAKLLRIHRWSLTHADLSYSLLRRILAAWFGQERGAVLAARLVAGLPNKSLELNRALAQLRGDTDWEAFAAAYGHRSFSLDVYRPTFAETPDEIRLLAASAPAAEPPAGDRLGWFPKFFLAPVLRLARVYMPLREDQRFFWQKTLAFERKMILRIGGLTGAGEDIFFATIDELRAAANRQTLPFDLMARRRAEFARLQLAAYPAFLKGMAPLVEATPDVLHGQGVSLGYARGPARIVTAPDQLDRLRAGDILVTLGADPGWTVVFGKIAGLVMETGGQLSHAAVVAREYGLPAVAGVRGATGILKDGQQITLDGLSGAVTPAQD